VRELRGDLDPCECWAILGWAQRALSWSARCPRRRLACSFVSASTRHNRQSHPSIIGNTRIIPDTNMISLYCDAIFCGICIIYIYIYIYVCVVICSSGGRMGIRPVKNWVVGCWHGYLCGARCRFAYGPADATATHCLASVKSRLVLPFWYRLTWVVLERAVKRVCVLWSVCYCLLLQVIWITLHIFKFLLFDFVNVFCASDFVTLSNVCVFARNFAIRSVMIAVFNKLTYLLTRLLSELITVVQHTST